MDLDASMSLEVAERRSTPAVDDVANSARFAMTHLVLRVIEQ